jgi:3-hydroxyisobutyrate dehydrogenase-like beta-hydroxyacid dehydrogenase
MPTTTPPGDTRPEIGFIGLGDQGLPMATAIAEAGYSLHVWARHPGSLDALGDAAYVRHDDTKDLAASCDVVGLCVSTDDDVMQVVTGRLLGGLRPGSVVVNHGTGTPRNAVRLTQACARAGVDVLDAPVSGGRPAAQARTLTTMVGGPQPVAERCEPVFRSFSRHVVYLGGTGSGQTAKLFNNALLMMNQASIAEIIELAAGLGMDPATLAEVLKLGSGSSSALTLLNTMVTPANVEHLARVQVLDMELFDTAMTESGLSANSVTARGLAGANGLSALLRRLNSGKDDLA